MKISIKKIFIFRLFWLGSGPVQFSVIEAELSSRSCYLQSGARRDAASNARVEGRTVEIHLVRDLRLFQYVDL